MYRNNNHGNQILRRFVQQAESYNRCMFPNSSLVSTSKQSQNIHDHVTEQILFCQNAVDNLKISTKNIDSTFKKPSNKEYYPLINEILTVDITSNGYQYETGSLKLNSIQSCRIISIISPYAFSIQLTKHSNEYDTFFKTMNDYYNSIDDLYLSIEYLRKNLLCVTWNATLATWNRSQIMEYDLINDTLNVFYVDLNSWEEHVPRSRIRFILTKYSSQPVFLLTCRLASISPLNNNHQWNDVVSKTFQNVIDNCKCDVEPLYKARDNTFYVNLFASHDEAYVCINDFLIHCKMAKPFDDISNEKQLNYMLDDDGKPMHSIFALFWKAEETMRETEDCVKKDDYDEHHYRSLESIDLTTTQCTSLVKVIIITEVDTVIFARYNSYIMLPWYTVSNLLNGINEEKIKNLATKYGFKPIIIDPLSHPLLCSQLIKLKSSTSASSQISLYSIDCVRKIFQVSNYQQIDVYKLLDCARLAEASDDFTFWHKPYESLSMSMTDQSKINDFIGLRLTMWSHIRSYSNPIYDTIDASNSSFNRPLIINIESIGSYPCTGTNHIPLLLLADCLTSPPSNNHHNYVNQRIDEEQNEENLHSLYAKPRKRCVTLRDEFDTIPTKTSRFSMKSIKPERAQLISTTLPAVTLLSSMESSDEIDQFIARENERVERVKLRRRQRKTTMSIKQTEKTLPAFSNPNYIEIPVLDSTEEKKLSKSILV